MEPEQNHEQTTDSTETEQKPKASSGHGLIGHVANLMGRTVGLAQSSGAKTADGIFAAGRQTGKLLHVPSKLKTLVAFGTEKKRKVEAEVEIERLGRRIERLYARIGERICHSPLFDRSLLSIDPQLEALVSTVRDLEVEVNDLHDQAQFVAEESRRPTKHMESESAVKTEPSCTRGSQESESSESTASPSPEEGEVPPPSAE